MATGYLFRIVEQPQYAFRALVAQQVQDAEMRHEALSVGKHLIVRPHRGATVGQGLLRMDGVAQVGIR